MNSCSLAAAATDPSKLADSKRLSIVLLIRSLETGGAERQLVHLARGLHQRGHRVTVVVFYIRGSLVAELKQAGVPIVDLRKEGRWDLLGFYLRARRAVREASPDVVYSFLGTANVVAALLRPLTSGFRLVWSIRASDVDLGTYDWTHRMSYELERQLSRAPDLIISNSHKGLKFASDHGFPLQRMSVVPNGIDASRFRQDDTLRMKQRATWGLADSDVAIGVLARLDPMKGHATFLRAGADLAYRYPHVRLFCIGEGVEEGRLRRLAVELGIAKRVEFTGMVADPVAALNALDICCSPSIFGEGFSNAIAEAMACGLPCVTTDVGDSALIVGDTGRIVPRSNPGALAEALIAEVAALGSGQGVRARARIAENFSIDTMVDRTLALLSHADDYHST